MPDSQCFDLALYRLEKARLCLADAELLLSNNSFLSASNRAYYAIFHSARALLALDGEDRKRHSGVISYFQEHYVKNGLFEKKYSYIIHNAFEVRQEADYEDFYLVLKDDAVLQVNNAKEFYQRVYKYITEFS